MFNLKPNHASVLTHILNDITAYYDVEFIS